MKLWKRIRRVFVKDKVMDQEETLKMIGALTVMELQNRSFRRKIENTDYARKLRRIVNF
jgi:hypothetical protein